MDNKISTFLLSKKLNITGMTVHRDLEKLKVKGLFERIGTDKGGYWKILR
jgi:DeoR/GlpR family transcriptional regulator of sugar metabolism